MCFFLGRYALLNANLMDLDCLHIVSMHPSVHNLLCTSDDANISIADLFLMGLRTLLLSSTKLQWTVSVISNPVVRRRSREFVLSYSTLRLGHLQDQSTKTISAATSGPSLQSYLILGRTVPFKYRKIRFNFNIACLPGVHIQHVSLFVRFSTFVL